MYEEKRPLVRMMGHTNGRLVMNAHKDALIGREPELSASSYVKELGDAVQAMADAVDSPGKDWPCCRGGTWARASGC